MASEFILFGQILYIVCDNSRLDNLTLDDEFDLCNDRTNQETNFQIQICTYNIDT